MNSASLLGRVGADPELRDVGSTQVCKLRLAEKVYRGKKGEVTQWWSVEIWGKRGAAAAQYLRKGTQVFVTGQVVMDEYEKDGQKRMAVSINANDWSFAAGKEDGGRSSSPREEPTFEGSQEDPDW